MGVENGRIPRLARLCYLWARQTYFFDNTYKSLQKQASSTITSHKQDMIGRCGGNLSVLVWAGSAARTKPRRPRSDINI
jgi:hypothetical protein